MINKSLFSGAIDVMAKEDSIMSESWNLKRKNDSVSKVPKPSFPIQLDVTNILDRHLKTNHSLFRHSVESRVDSV